MKVLFIQKDVFAKPAIMSLSAVLKKGGHDCGLLVDDLEKDVAGSAIKIKPDIIAFSITTGEYSWMKETGSAIRKKFDRAIICGGSHPTFYPDVINDSYLDAVCVGEGETALAEYVNTLQSGGNAASVRNFIVKKDGKIFKNGLRPLIDDLDSLPFYDREIYAKYNLYKNSNDSILFHNVVITSRGCPYKCAFCFNKLYNELYRGKGCFFRRRSVSHVINELKEMTKDKQLSFLSIEDDSFLIPPREWINEFLEEYKAEINIPFKILTPANLIDGEIVRKLKAANCYSVKIGVETGNEEYRIKVLNKKTTNAEIISASRLIKKFGLRLQTYNMMGCPGETLDMALETYQLNRIIGADFVWCSLLNPYPGTEIYNYALNKGCLEESFDFEKIGYSYFIDTPIKLEHKRQIMNLQKVLYPAVLLRLPAEIMRILIKLPLSKIYNKLFGLGFFIGLYRINKIGFLSLLRLSLSKFIKYI